MAKDYKELRIWQQSMELVTDIYRLMEFMPKEELFALTNQIKRASVSVPSNIAEGESRGKKEFAHFLRISLGSLSELDTQLRIAINLKFLSEDSVLKSFKEIESLKKQINKLRSYLLGQ